MVETICGHKKKGFHRHKVDNNNRANMDYSYYKTKRLHHKQKQVTTSTEQRTRYLSPFINLALAAQTKFHKYLLLSSSSSSLSSSKLILLMISICILTTCFQPTFVSGQQLRNQLPSFFPEHSMRDFHIDESKPIGSIVYTLKGVDPKGGKVNYAISTDIFSVDSETGDVKLIKPLDRETKPRLDVIISISDINGEVTSLKRTIIVDDADDSWPIFQPNINSTSRLNPATLAYNSYSIKVSESVPKDQIVTSDFIVTDADEGVNADIIFECRSTKVACETFDIVSRRIRPGRYHFNLRTKQNLDFEQIQSYKLTVVAKGRGLSRPLEAEAIIDITVLNVQDERPKFVNAPYSLSVDENTSPGTVLLKLNVQDGDLQDQRKLSVMIIGDDNQYFAVTQDADYENIWYLETSEKRRIDREDPYIMAQGGLYEFTLAAVELDNDKPIFPASDETSATTSVSVMILDVKDSPPQFSKMNGLPLEENHITLNMSESITTGTAIAGFDLLVSDADLGNNAIFQLALSDSEETKPASQVFAIEPAVVYGQAPIILRVTNSSMLDYEDEQYRTYKFMIVARKDDMTTVIDVTINVHDANDNTPQFSSDNFSIQVLESIPVNTVIYTLTATDKDSGEFGEITYTLNGFEAKKFKLNVKTGEIMVADCGQSQCLDYESESIYSLTYEARDGGGKFTTASLIIEVLDTNDHAPVFSESVYKREIITDNLNQKQNYISPPLVVKAKDDDSYKYGGKGNVRYRMKSTNLTSLTVDPITGLVSLSKPLEINKLIPKNNGDRKITFLAEVLAEDNGQPPLSSAAIIVLTVKGDRDGAPRFINEPYRITLEEDQPRNVPIFRVQANDPDGKDSQLRYSVGDDKNNLVNIDATTGELSIDGKAELDYNCFKDKRYNITVYATDDGKPYPLTAQTTVTFIIEDVNNKPPKFRSSEVSSFVTEGITKVNDVVAKVEADDPDTKAILHYSIEPELTLIRDRSGILFTMNDIINSTDRYLNELPMEERINIANRYKRMFSIDSNTGEIRLMLEPEFSSTSLINLTVRVTDKNQYNLSGMEPQQVDESNCILYLQSSVDRSPTFDAPWRGNGREYKIDIDEELLIGSTIMTLVARDPLNNQPIRNMNKVFESDPMSYFNVDPLGVISIARRIDYEELPYPKQLRLSVRAIGSVEENEVPTSTTHIIINVKDLNDNSPNFTSGSYSASISEAATYPQSLLTVVAEDRDSNDQGPYGQVFYEVSGHGSDVFDIDPLTGLIFVRMNVRLDRESESSYLLQVIASDCNKNVTSEMTNNQNRLQGSNCRKTSTFVDIKILDENDNRPQWVMLNQNGDYEAVVAETAALDTVVTQVKAIDLDQGPNGNVEYELSHGESSISRCFKMEASTGTLRVAGPLSGFGRRDPYRLIIRAFDHGKISNSSTINLALVISDVAQNDGVPRFIKPELDEIIFVSEMVRQNQFVYQVIAKDTDDESSINGKVMYRFMQPSDVFEIDPFKGTITTLNKHNFFLDRESTPNYTLVVIAHDLGTPPKQAYRILNIQIGDVNDNEPYFERGFDDPPLILNVEEELEPNTLIGTIQAIDRDIGRNALISYEIIEGNVNNAFSLKFDIDNEQGNNNCEIYTTKRLDREERESYTLTIKANGAVRNRNSIINALQQHHRAVDPLATKLASHSGYSLYNASDLSRMRLTIKLIDINDNRPKFNNPNPKLVVDSSVEVYSQLVSFQATDPDSSDSDIQYSLIDVVYHSDNSLPSAESSQINPMPSALSSQDQYKSQPMSIKRIFEIDRSTGILRNLVPLRQFVDGYFEVFVKADSGLYKLIKDHTDDLVNLQSILAQTSANCMKNNNLASGNYKQQQQQQQQQQAIPNIGQDQANNNINPSVGQSETMYDCFVATTKATLFITHQRDTFRFVFNKTKLNEKMDEFREKVQNAMELQMIDDAHQRTQSSESLAVAKAEKLFLNVFNTEFYEKEDGSLDYATITYCSQLVKFNDKSSNELPSVSPYELGDYGSNLKQMMNNNVPLSSNQIISYNQAIDMFKMLNETSQKKQQSSLFLQYGLINIERCVPSKTTYRMTKSEVAALLVAASIAVIGLLLSCIASRMKKNFKKEINLYQNAKYQYMSHYATLPAHQSRTMHPMHNPNQYAPPYGAYDYDSRTLNQGLMYETWQV